MFQRSGSQSDSGMLYQYAVTAFLAGQLSTNDEVEDYVIYSSEASAGKFDDIVARVKLKQRNDRYLWLIQVKYRENRDLKIHIGSKAPLFQYISSFNTITNDANLEHRKGISNANIVFGIVCNKSIETPIRLSNNPRIEVSLTSCAEGVPSKNFLPVGTNFQRFNCQSPGYSQNQNFFNECFLWLGQTEEDIHRNIEQMCEIENANDIVSYTQAYFHDKGLIQQGLKKEVFEIELQKIRLLSFIPPITRSEDLADDSWIKIWNEITLEHDITIVDDSQDSDIQHYLYKCLLQQLNTLLNTNIDWNIYVSNQNLDGEISRQFVSHSETKPLRYWVTQPSTLRTLIIELWKCGDLSLILKTNSPLNTFEKYQHLKRSYTIVVDDLEERSQEISSSKLKIFQRINSIDNTNLRDDMLKNTLVSLQGRQETTLQDLLHQDRELMATFTCADIIRIMKSRVRFLQEDSLNNTNHIVFLITSDKYRDVKSIEPQESGGNIKIYCHSNYRNKCLQEIKTDSKLKEYMIYELRQVRDQLELIDGDANRLSNYIIDQFGNPLYTSNNKCIPVIGQPVQLEKHQYLTRNLSRATVNKSFFRSENKRICLLSGELQDVIEELSLTNIEDISKKMRLDEEKCYFVKVEGESSQNYWDQLDQLGCIYDIKIIKDGKWELLRHKHYIDNGDIPFKNKKLELLQCQNCKDLGSNISYQGEQLREDEFIKTISNRSKEIIVITGDAGIGKSSLLKSLSYNCSTKDYVLFYDLINFQVCLNEKKNPFDDPVKFLMKEFHKGKSEAYYDFLERLLEKKRLVLILDSFDEIMLTCRKEVLKFIRCIVKKDIRIIIATRVKEFTLIDQFNAQTVKINPFDSEADDTYLLNWDLSKDTLTNVSSELITNPLYLNFLRVIASNQEELNITKFMLYKKVIKMKIKRWLQKNCKLVSKKMINEMITTFQQLALVRMFDKGLVEKEFKWKCEEKTLSDYIHCGIISRFDERDHPVFHHYTFVEFLVAQWIIKAIEDEEHKRFAVDLYERLFRENKYDVLKILFDYAGVDLNLHVAIWQVDVYEVDTMGDQYNWHSVDNLGRTPLHVAVICCANLNHRYMSYVILEFIVKFMRKYSTDMNKPDIMECYWIDYVQPKTFEYACTYDCISTVETYLRSLKENIDKLNFVFPLKKFKNIFSWALSSLSIESIGDLLLMQNLNTDGFYPYYKLCVHSTEDVQNCKTNFEIEGNLTPLHIACIYGNVEMVRYHIERTTDIDMVDRFSYTPLSYSVKRYLSVALEKACEAEKIIRLLLENGADPHYLIIDGNDEISSCRKATVMDLLKNTKTVSRKTKINAKANTSLHDAVLDGNLVLIKQLINNGIEDVNKRDKDGRTALKLATIEGNEKVVEFLLKKGADIKIKSDVTDETALHCAAKNGCAKIVKMLLDKGADLHSKDIDDSTPLFYAAYGGHANIIELLLQYGAGNNKAYVNVQNVYGSTPLHVASGENEKVNAVRVLLEHGAKVNATDKHNSTPLHFAMEYRNKKVVALLLEKGANVNAEAIGNYTALHFAAKWNDIDLVKLLLSKGANTNIRSTHNLTPLDLGIRNGNVELVSLLLDKGSNVSGEDRHGCTPLHFAAWQGNSEVVELLLAREAKVNIKNKDKITPLAVAVHKGHADIVHLLLDQGASVNFQDAKGETPLHVAAKMQNLDIVKLLLEKGANAKVQNTDRLLAIHYINDKGSELFRLLKKKTFTISEF